MKGSIIRSFKSTKFDDKIISFIVDDKLCASSPGGPGLNFELDIGFKSTLGTNRISLITYYKIYNINTHQYNHNYD